MSKLVTALHILPAKLRRPSDQKFVGVTEFKDGFHPRGTETEYVVEASYRVHSWLSTLSERDSSFDYKKMILDNARRQIAEAVFGEFRKPLNKIREAIADGDLIDAMDRVDKLEDQMFGVDYEDPGTQLKSDRTFFRRNR